jgi:hypothetical protein
MLLCPSYDIDDKQLERLATDPDYDVPYADRLQKKASTFAGRYRYWSFAESPRGHIRNEDTDGCAPVTWRLA